MPFTNPELPDILPQCTVLAFSPACEALAAALAACWPGAALPSMLRLDGTANVANLSAQRGQDPVLLLIRDTDEAKVADFNRWIVNNEVPALIVLDLAAGLWALWRADARVAPCVSCLARQREFMPHGAGAPAAGDTEKAACVARALHSCLAGQPGAPASILFPVRAAPGARRRQVVQDPLCPHCSVHAVRPNHVFFTAD